MHVGPIPRSPSSEHHNIQLPDDEGGLELGRIIEALYRQIFLIAGLTFLMAGAGTYKAVTDQPIYASKFEILTEPVTVENQVISSVSESLSASEADTFTLDETKIKVLRSPEVLNPAVEILQRQYPEITYDLLKYDLGIKASQTNVLEVSFQNPNKALVTDLLSTVSEVYLRYSLNERKADIQQGLDFVNDQLPELNARVEGLQEQLQTLRQRYNLIDPTTTGEQLSAQISTVQEQQLDTRIQLNEIRALRDELREELATQSPENVLSSALKNNPQYQELLNQLQTIDGQIARDSVLLLEESPEIKLLNEQRDRLLPLLDQEVQRTIRELDTQIQEIERRGVALDGTLNQFQDRVKQLSVVNRSFTDIERELQIATENLNQFLTTRDSLRIEIAQRQVPWRLLEPVAEPRPSTASAARNLVLGAIVGFMLGCGAALALDSLSNVLHTPKEVKKITQLSLLGIIPRKRDLSDFAPAVDLAPLSLTHTYVAQTRDSSDVLDLPTATGSWLDPVRDLLSWGLKGTPFANLVPSTVQEVEVSSRSVFSEAFHALAANVRLLDADDPVRAVVIASATAGEGKTTIAAYLAQAVARMNRRVLVVDTDLRRPQIHQRLGLVNGDGLTDVLSGDLSPEEAIQASALDENLFVLTAGMLPPDPIRLISSQKMQELMRSLREQFDLVIYDAPPLAGLADAHLLAAHSDGLLLVAGLGELKRSALEQSLYELSVANTPVLGAIANFAKEAASYPSKGSDRKVTPTPSSSTPTSKELASLAGTAAPSKKLIPPPKH
jgi:capsular exopolysaccharide synthesis family protein